MNFSLAASFLLIQKPFFFLIALKTKQLFFHLSIQNKLHCVYQAALCCWSLLNKTQHSFHVLVDHSSNCANFLPRATTRLDVLAKNNNKGKFVTALEQICIFGFGFWVAQGVSWFAAWAGSQVRFYFQV